MVCSSMSSVPGDIQNSGTMFETAALPLTSSPCSSLCVCGVMFSSLHALVLAVPSAWTALPFLVSSPALGFYAPRAEDLFFLPLGTIRREDLK